MLEVLSAHGRVAAALIAPSGPECVQALAKIDPRGLSASAQVDLLIAWERQNAWLASRVQAVVAAGGESVQAAATRSQG